MKPIQVLVKSVFLKEGDIYSEPPKNDQPTGRGGITLGALQRYRTAHEEVKKATVADLKALTRPKAEAVVQWLLESLGEELQLEEIVFEDLRMQVLDFAYNSGGPLALRWLQRVLRVPRTGRMDDMTIEALGVHDQWLVHHALIAARLQMIDMWTDAPENKKFEEGLENRVHSFSLLQIP